jgi:hypothetical protein
MKGQNALDPMLPDLNNTNKEGGKREWVKTQEMLIISFCYAFKYYIYYM